LTPTNRVLVFVPTFNDLVLLARICSDILSLPGDYSVLVIDDGSDPMVNRSILPERAKLLRLPDNYGLGLCTHVAIDHMLAHGYGVLARIDSDGQHPVEALPRLVAAIDQGIDLVIGGRVNRGSGRGLRRLAVRLVHLYYRGVARLMTGQATVHDLTSGLHALNIRTAVRLRELPLERYPEPEIAILALIGGLKVGQIDVSQLERSDGSSSISLRRGVLLFYRFNIFALDLLLKKKSLR